MKKLMFAIGICVALASCEKLETVPMTANSWFPLDSGNQWTYADTVFLWLDSAYQLPRTSYINWFITRTGYYDLEEEGELRRVEASELAMEQNGQFLFYPIRPEAGRIRRLPRTAFLSPRNIDPLYELLEIGPWSEESLMEIPLDSGDVVNLLPFGWIDQGEFRPNSSPWVNSFPPGGISHDGNRVLLLPPAPLSGQVLSGSRSVTTAAGTFDCLDLGNYFWAENVGFVGAFFEYQWAYWDEDLQDSVEVRLLRKRELVRFDPAP